MKNKIFLIFLGENDVVGKVVYTFVTEIKYKEFNQEVFNYFFDYSKDFNKIKRRMFHVLKNLISNSENKMKESEIKKYLYHLIIDEYDLSSRAVDSIVSGVIGDYNSHKELKKDRIKRAEKRIDRFYKDLGNLEKERFDVFNEKELSKLKITKQKIYHLKNKINKERQILENLKEEVKSGKIKVCFGTKNLLKKNKSEFRKQRDGEIFFVGRAGDNRCNNNFQLLYNKKINQFYFKVRKEKDLQNGKYIHGKVYLSKEQKHIIKQILIDKSSALSYRIKHKNGKLYLHIIFSKEHNKEMCLTSKFYGSVGIDFNKGFVSVSEINEHGNLLNTFNIKYRYGQGNKTDNDLKIVAKALTEYCLNTGKDLVIEDLDFSKTKSQNVKGKTAKSKNYNRMLNTLAYSKFKEIIERKCCKMKVFITKVNPANTSKIAKNKYCFNKKLNVHNGASYVIARRGKGLEK